MLFLERVVSQYTSNVSFRSTDQEGILASRIEDYGRRNEVEASLLENPSFRIFPENPLQMGFFLESIIPGKQDCFLQGTKIPLIVDGGETLDLIESYDCVSGEIMYKIPEKGNFFR